MNSWEEEVRRFLLDEEDEDDELCLVMVSVLQLCLYDEKRPEHTSSLPGAKEVKEILEGHEKRCEDDYSIQKCIDIVDAMEDLTDEQKADANELFQSEMNRQISVSTTHLGEEDLSKSVSVKEHEEERMLEGRSF